MLFMSRLSVMFPSIDSESALIDFRLESQLLGLHARIVLWIDVVKVPRPVCADLENRVFVKEDIVRHTRDECEEAPRGQKLGLALIGSFSHAQTERPREDGDDLHHGMRMGRNAVRRSSALQMIVP